jgi:hypothetical protein
VQSGHCLERAPAGHDTDTARDFHDNPRPSPGFASELLTPPETPTATPQEGVSSVRGVSGSGDSDEQGAGPPWPWIILASLMLVAGVGAGAGLHRFRSRSRHDL